MNGAVGIASYAIGIIAAVLVVFKALRMKKLECYGWAITAAIVALVPCVSPCCLLRVPIGISAVIMLGEPGEKRRSAKWWSHQQCS